jgi:exportin-1
LDILRNANQLELTIQALEILLSISTVDENEVFKICLDYWLILVKDLYNLNMQTSQIRGNPDALEFGSFGGLQLDPRVAPFAPLLSRLRLVLISKMAKPEEVLIVENEHGEIVRETMKDTDMINIYKSMREALIFLTHLDPEDTQNIMLKKLSLQMDGSEWSWNNLNTLCWAIGSISGAMSERLEKRFLVSVIRDLLSLCEMKRGKSHKAVMRSLKEFKKWLVTHF